MSYGTSGASNGQLTSLTLNPAAASGGGTNTASTIPLMSEIRYTGIGQARSWTWGNHSAAMPNQYARSFDALGRVTSFPLSTGTAAALLRTVVYDGASLIKAYTHQNASGTLQSLLSHTMVYDELDRLTSWSQGNTSKGYAYDTSGNRTQVTQNGVSYGMTVSATSNRITQVGGPQAYTPTYDTMGNMTANGTATFTYNDRGRLQSAQVGTSTITYAINGMEQRVRKFSPNQAIIPTGESLFAYDENSQLLGEYDANLKPRYETIYLGTTPVVVLTQTTSAGQANTWVNYAYADQIDTVRTITRASDNQTVWTWDQADPFGTEPANENPAGLGTFSYAPRFPGQVYDQETNLHYNVNRDYDPQTGRYIQSDPIGLAGGINTYGYVGSNPLTFFDSLGLSKDSVTASVEAAISSGNTQKLQTLIESGALNPAQLQVAEAGAARLASTAEQIIARECKGTVLREFPGQLKQKTLAELLQLKREGAEGVNKALKLLNDSRFKK